MGVTDRDRVQLGLQEWLDRHEIEAMSGDAAGMDIHLTWEAASRLLRTLAEESSGDV